MALYEELVTQGNWLFRWRSYLPLALAAPMLVAMLQFECSGQIEQTHKDWIFTCLAVSLTGLGIRVLTVGHVAQGTSGRETRGGPAAKTFNTTGMYSIVRHPLYLGNAVVGLGISLFFLEWWLTVLVMLGFWVYYERIMFAEEEYLRQRFGEAYLEWAERTPAFIPRLSRWEPPSLPFSSRVVLGRENTTLYLIVSCFFVLGTLERLLMGHKPSLDPLLTGLFLGGTVLYLALKFLKKRTTILKVDGR